MAHNAIFFENPRSARQRKAPVGFSWTTLFFGPMPLLFRGEMAWFLVSLGLTVLTLHTSNVVLAFMVNRLYIQDLLKRGFKARNVLHGDMDEVAKELGLRLPSLASSLFYDTQSTRL